MGLSLFIIRVGLFSLVTSPPSGSIAQSITHYAQLRERPLPSAVMDQLVSAYQQHSGYRTSERTQKFGHSEFPAHVWFLARIGQRPFQSCQIGTSGLVRAASLPSQCPAKRLKFSMRKTLWCSEIRSTGGPRVMVSGTTFAFPNKAMDGCLRTRDAPIQGRIDVNHPSRPLKRPKVGSGLRNDNTILETRKTQKLYCALYASCWGWLAFPRSHAYPSCRVAENNELPVNGS